MLHGTPSPKDSSVRALVLAPTRELAVQIEESFHAYGQRLPLRAVAVFGGVSQTEQINKLKNGADILVATPGRLLDLMQQGYADISRIGFLVLDEADRMLDMGFIRDVKKILGAVPQKRQTLFFSATMPPAISELADGILTDPIKISVTPVSSTTESVGQSVYFVDKQDKRKLLSHILKDSTIIRSLVFTRTKHGADKLVKELFRTGISAAAIHGNKSQNARQRALHDFKYNKIRVLVATDIAARGIDIDGLPHVINYELPDNPETYVHRIGRTGRAGSSGTAISFCDKEEITGLKDIQKLIGFRVPVAAHPYA